MYIVILGRTYSGVFRIFSRDANMETLYFAPDPEYTKYYVIVITFRVKVIFFSVLCLFLCDVKTTKNKKRKLRISCSLFGFAWYRTSATSLKLMPTHFQPKNRGPTFSQTTYQLNEKTFSTIQFPKKGAHTRESIYILYRCALYYIGH